MAQRGARPVIVGIGQVANKDPEHFVHPVALLEEATSRAVGDAGADVLPHVGLVLSSPLSVFSEDDGGAMVADRVGIAPGLRVQGSYSGAGPQRMLAQACRAVAAGEVDAALVVGGIADASVRNARRAGVEPPAPPTSMWSQGTDGMDSGRLEFERVEKYRHAGYMAEGAAGAQLPAAIFALVESALAHRNGRGPAEEREWLGHLMAPFTAVAARRPDLAWLPEVRSAEEISTVRPDNRFVAEPYPKAMCSFPTIDLAAAVLVTSEDLAARIGVSATVVHPWSITCASEAGPPSRWPDMTRPRALAAAVERVLATTGVDPDEIAGFDLYSCFPAAVQLGAEAFGVRPVTDPRPLTRTGGLPYFGGPGASYSLHGIACTVEDLRAGPGSVGAVVGVGGACHDFSVGLFSVEPPRRDQSFAEATDITEACRDTAVHSTPEATGRAVVEAMTVFHERDRGPVEAPVVARLADGSRTGARPADPELPSALSGTSLVGTEVELAVVDGATVYAPI